MNVQVEVQPETDGYTEVDEIDLALGCWEGCQWVEGQKSEQQRQ